jgi:condensin complex subunit 2
MSESPSTPHRRRVPTKKATIETPPEREREDKREREHRRESRLLSHSTSSNTPLRTTMRANQLINDDAAERAARRKSAHFADIGLIDKENRTASPVVRKASTALHVQKERRAKRLSAVTPAPQVSMEVMNTNFEEWMKLATDNVSGLQMEEKSG